ncbi:hypothetical protein PFISCL1PPCAC_11184, partial [Pristionchus fissidentatus]
MRVPSIRQEKARLLSEELLDVGGPVVEVRLEAGQVHVLEFSNAGHDVILEVCGLVGEMSLNEGGGLGQIEFVGFLGGIVGERAHDEGENEEKGEELV